jgi:hypothetical protein
MPRPSNRRYAVMLRPLSRGNHVIHFEGAQGPSFGGVVYSVTYNLTVQ